MIQLYDFFNEGSKDLYYSLKHAGINSPVVIFNDDGFLPDGVSSPYAYFCQMETGKGKPIYFNQVPVPTYWEISGDNAHAEVWFYQELKAKIFYTEPKHRRLVKNVDWYDKHGKVRFTDHYNQFGWLFARTYFNSDEKVTIKTYFNQDGQEIIVEHFLTGDIILNWEGKTHFFENQLHFFSFYINLMGFDQSEIWYNSLSTPFFYSYYHTEKGKDILFWQEDIGDTIPGNMQVLLNQDDSRTQTIIVQQTHTYHQLMRLLPEKDKLKCHQLGHIYPIRRPNYNRKTIFIFTNSDQIEALDVLTEALPDYQFHIAALTEMSQHLTIYDRKDNVQLYPNISPRLLKQLYDSCDIYLDINRGSEVMSVIRHAFEHSLLILGFHETAHNPSFVLKKHLFHSHQVTELIALLRSYEGRLSLLAEEQTKTYNASPINYQQLLGMRRD